MVVGDAAAGRIVARLDLRSMIRRARVQQGDDRPAGDQDGRQKKGDRGAYDGFSQHTRRYGVPRPGTTIVPVA